jgi:hypothetical protein
MASPKEQERALTPESPRPPRVEGNATFLTRHRVHYLPEHVLEHVTFRDTTRFPAGYYLGKEPVKFFNNYWYFAYHDVPANEYYTFDNWRIERNTYGAGFWHPNDEANSENRPPVLPEINTESIFQIGSEPPIALLGCTVSVAPSSSIPHTGPSFTTPRARADTLESNNLEQEVPATADSEESDTENSNSSSKPSYKDPAKEAPAPDPKLQLDTEIVTAAV